jgi:hypothetical protein
VRRLLFALPVAAGLVLAIAGIAPVGAASVDFGEPSAEAVFTEAARSLTFTQPVTLPSKATRVEILLELPDSLGPYVREVTAPAGTGAQRLLFDWDFVEDGYLVPNTPVTASWRVTVGEGAGATVAVGPPVRIVVEDQRYDWRTKNGDFVRLHWYDGSEAFATRALAIGDEAVRKAAELFGVEETVPIDFFVYADSSGLYGAMGPGTPENVGGQAHPDIRTMFASIAPGGVDDPWVADVVPHELTHLVFATAVENDYHQPPRWLNEGVATYLSVGYTPEWRGTTEAAIRGGTLVPLHALVDQFPTTSTLFYQAYGISTSAVHYLIRTYGSDAMVTLVRSYAEGVSDDEAFRAAIGVDTAAFEAAWLADIGASMPEQQGPRSAPPGPLPPDWVGSPVPGQTSAPGNATPAPSGATGGPTATPAPSAGESGTPGSGTGDTVVLVGAGVVVLVAVVVLAAWAVRGRRGGAA